MSDPAAELNSRIRAEIVSLWTTMGRKDLAKTAESDDLIEAIGLIFAHLADAEARRAPKSKLMARVAELRDELAGHATDAATIAELNKRLREANLRADAAEVKLAQARRVGSPA